MKEIFHGRSSSLLNAEKNNSENDIGTLLLTKVDNDLGDVMHVFELIT